MTESAGTVSVHPMSPSEIADADRIFRLAFSTFLELPDPATFMAGREVLRGRYNTDPGGTLAATDVDALVGSNFVAHWGSFGFFGPLTVDPKYWGTGVAANLLEHTMDLFDAWGTKSAALFTFAESSKHHALYQKFGFWPRFLTTIMHKPVNAGASNRNAFRFSEADATGKASLLRDTAALCSEVYDGLDLSREIRGVDSQHLGDTILLGSDKRLEAFAICHYGPGSEGDDGGCYVKFAIVRQGRHAREHFVELLEACESLAHRNGLTDVEAGVNLERVHAYQSMLGYGFRGKSFGVRMVRGADPGYNRPDIYAIDDLR
jgi:GNAT superfamily N-acetyltransferase